MPEFQITTSKPYNPEDYGLPVWRDEDHQPPPETVTAEKKLQAQTVDSMTIEAAKNKICAWALSQVGYHEEANNWQKYAESADLQAMYGWKPQNQPWCFTANTLVLTQDGYKQIQDVNVGDFVLNAHGDRFNRITKIDVHDSQVRDYRVYGAIPFSVTFDHPFLSEKRIDKYHRKRGFKDWGFHPIEALHTGDMIASPKSPVLYEDSLSYDDLWIVGYYVGDGYCSRRSEYVLCANEEKAVKVKLHAAAGHWDKDYESRTCKQFNLSVSGNPLLKETLNDCGHGAVHKRVPKRILFGTLDAKRAFLDGYFSADGCNKYHSFNSVSAELVTGIARLLTDLDNPCSIAVQKRPPQSKIWDARLNAYRVINQREIIYNCSVCNTDDSKHQDFIAKDKYVMLPLRYIGDERTDTVYTITTDGDHTYTANNLSVHNCDVFVDSGFIECFGLKNACAMTYQPMGAGSALCKQSAQYYMDHDAWIPRGKTPEIGDQVFFYASGDINHTGIVIRVDGGSVHTVEGNTSDMVAERVYSVSDSKIAGYGRPDWSIVADVQKTEKPQESQEKQDEQRYYELRFPYLSKGSYGNAVKAVQFQLAAQGYYIGPDGADGDFGGNTENAVKEFQRTVGLSADGTVGPDTGARLFGATVGEAPKVEKKEEVKQEVKPDTFWNNLLAKIKK